MIIDKHFKKFMEHATFANALLSLNEEKTEITNYKNKNICIYDKINKRVVPKNEIYKWLGIWKMRDNLFNKLIVNFINLFFMSAILLPLFSAIILFLNGVFQLNIPFLFNENKSSDKNGMFSFLYWFTTIIFLLHMYFLNKQNKFDEQIDNGTFNIKYKTKGVYQQLLSEK